MSHPIMLNNTTRSEQINARSLNSLIDVVEMLRVFESIDMWFTGEHSYIVDADCEALTRLMQVMCHQEELQALIVRTSMREQWKESSLSRTKC